MAATLYPVHNVFLAYRGSLTIQNSTYPVLFDTTSCLSWVKNENSNKTEYVAPRLVYPDGTVVDGYYANDTIKIENFTISNFIYESATIVTPDSSANKGVLGLCHLSPLPSTTTNRATRSKFQFSSFLDDLVRNSYISEKIFAFSISNDTQLADISFGATNSTKYTGNVAWIPVNPLSRQWEANIASITSSDAKYQWNSNGTIQMSVTFDTSSSMMVLPPAMSRRLNSLFSFSRLSGSGVYGGNCPSQMPDTIRFSFPKTNTTTVSLNVQTKVLIYGDGIRCFSAIMDGQTVDKMIFGNALLRNYYTIFNGNNHSIGFASLSTTFDSNQKLNDPPKTKTGNNNKYITAGVVVGSIIVAIVVIIVLLWKNKRKVRKERKEKIKEMTRHTETLQYTVNDDIGSFKNDEFQHKYIDQNDELRNEYNNDGKFQNVYGNDNDTIVLSEENYDQLHHEKLDYSYDTEYDNRLKNSLSDENLLRNISCQSDEQIFSLPSSFEDSSFDKVELH